MKPNEEAVIDSTMLMAEGFLDAMSRVSDNEQCTDLAKPRREHLRELLKEDASDKKGYI